MNVINHKPVFNIVKQSDEQKAANKKAFAIRFAASQVIGQVIPNDRPEFNSSTPIAASIAPDREIGGYKPKRVIKHNHYKMSWAYNVIENVSKSPRVTTGGYKFRDFKVSHEGIEEIGGVYKTMSERIESAGDKVSAFISVPETAHTIAVRKSDKAIAAFSFKHNAVNVQFVKGIDNKTVDTPFISGFRNIAAAMAGNGYAGNAYHRPSGTRANSPSGVRNYAYSFTA